MRGPCGAGGGGCGQGATAVGGALRPPLPDPRRRSNAGPTPSTTPAGHPRPHPPAQGRRGERGRAGRDAGGESPAADTPSCAQRSAGPVLARPGRVGVAGRSGLLLAGAERVEDIVGVGEGGEGHGQVDSAAEPPAPLAPAAVPLRWEGLAEHVFGDARDDGGRCKAGCAQAARGFPVRLWPAGFPVRLWPAGFPVRLWPAGFPVRLWPAGFPVRLWPARLALRLGPAGFPPAALAEDQTVVPSEAQTSIFVRTRARTSLVNSLVEA